MIWAIAALLFSFFTQSSTAPSSSPPVTFNKQIAPIVYANCSTCHRPGETAPFSLLTYEDVRKHSAQIVAVTRKRYMPPWLPTPGYGDFAGERRLTDEQIQLLAHWVAGGCKQGDPADLPAAPHFTEGWQLGPPDLIARIPKPYRLTAGGLDVFRNFIVPVDVQETKYVRAIEMRPGNKRIVHHANILIDRRHTLRTRDGEDGQPGFPGILTTTESRSDAFDPDSHFLFWKPGSVLQLEPPDMSWRLDPGTDLILNMHLRPTGKEEMLQPDVGFYFTSQPPTRHPMLVQLEDDGAIDIPPGSRDFSVEDHLTLSKPVSVLAIYPHAHYLGKQIEAWATLPDGSRTWLIKIDDWDINWSAVYNYRSPVSLPKGTTVAMRIMYDNTEDNPRNPNDPPKRVRYGPRSEDEMGHVWLQVLPVKETNEDPRVVLQEAVMRRRLEKYPDDFVAHCNLGQLLVSRKNYREAISHFRAALQQEPESATAHSGLGAALLAQGQYDDAIREFREALRIEPDHLNARLNLARALGSKGDMNGAAQELEEVLKFKPDNTDAHVGLGLILFNQHRYSEALPHFQEAALRRPDDADIQTNLGLLLAMQGDLSAAIRAFGTALKVNPKDETARSYLERAQAMANKR
jgi:Flp pilus assembly protein TadD/mono/diheme cytochrome c family protein